MEEDGDELEGALLGSAVDGASVVGSEEGMSLEGKLDGSEEDG